jgi:hypothetical protein
LLNTIQCATYENLWIWDLSLSCIRSADDSVVNGCTCAFAEELRDFELLSCKDMSRCPNECPICSSCLALMGCGESTNPSEISVWASTADRMYIIAAVVFSFVITLAASYYVRKRFEASGLGECLIDDQERRTFQQGYYGADSNMGWRPSSTKQDALIAMQQVNTGGQIPAGSRCSRWEQLHDDESVLEETRSDVGDTYASFPPDQICTSGFAQLTFDNDTLQVVDAIANLENGRVSPTTTTLESSDDGNNILC